MDALSQVLQSIRLAGGIFLDAHFTAPWSVLSEMTVDDCKPFMVRPAHIIAYHYVIQGSLYLMIDGAAPHRVSAGELVLLPRNDAHTLADAPCRSNLNAHDLIQPADGGGLARVSHGGGGAATNLVCGFLGSADAFNPLIASLPRVLTLNVTAGASRAWVEASVKYAASELASGRLTSPDLMARLSELLFVEAVRGYVAALGNNATGWLRGVADPQIGRALALIHSDSAGHWTVDDLARSASMSRSAFVDRFTALVGMPPIRYLTRWRLHLAQQHLRERHMTMAILAHTIGYESEAAFSRAFKREFGVPPSTWRDQQTAAWPTR
jgi:AraC-like DNA-binding protein